jgi:hypothetical protein
MKEGSHSKAEVVYNGSGGGGCLCNNTTLTAITTTITAITPH